MNNELEHQRDDNSRDVAETKPQPLNVRPVPKSTPSLIEQWTLLGKIEVELRDRIRRERDEIMSEHDRRWVEINNEYKKRMSEDMARLEHLRDMQLKELRDQTDYKLREHEILAKRMQE